MGKAFDALSAHLREIDHIEAALELMGWDQQVLMPPEADEARAAQLETLSRLSHEKFTSEQTLRLLDAAEAEISGADPDSDQARLISVVRQDYAEQTRLPSELVAEVTRVTAMAHGVWAAARAENDFARFAPTLTRQFELARQTADYLGYSEHPYDALLNLFERGMTSRQVQAIFEEHKAGLVKLIAAISERTDSVDDSPVHQAFDVEAQRQFGLKVIGAIGFDFKRGRQDVSVHPFAQSTSKYDVRITTRFSPDFLNPALFGMMHETGHAMYEQGISDDLAALPPLDNGTSLGVHESQSRMWENIVGRSHGFWTWAYPQLQAAFPAQLGGVNVEQFYRAVNKVTPSYIRVEADEATYNLHIMLRFELEMALLNGQLAVADLPRAWNERFEAYFGIVPPTDSLGVLQDVHWSSGLIGYFPTYALGNMLAAQYYRKAIVDRPQIPADIANGKFDTLLGWLRENIHQHGRKFTADELTRRITGEGIQQRYYLEYLQEKYGAIYGL